VGNLPIVRLLIKRNVALDIPSCGIDQHAQSNQVVTLFDDPRSPLWVATYNGNKEIAWLLIAAGCRIATEAWIGLGEFPRKDGRNEVDEELKELLRNHYSTPLPLTFQCRVALRRLAGREVRRFTLHLHLTERFRNFIAMKELLE
jgi:hypothetical protein